jgi:epoxyqueuosine reductase
MTGLSESGNLPRVPITAGGKAVAGSQPAAIPELDGTIERLAREAGFSRAGIAPVWQPGEGPSGMDQFPDQFADWVERGYAGEMEYLKRRDDGNRLVRSSLRIAFPWARSVIVCAANYHAGHQRSIDTAPEGSAWVARYAWTGYQKAGGHTDEDESASGDALKPGVQESEQAKAVADALAPTDYHTILLARLRRLELSLQQSLGGFQSRCYVDTGPVVERVYAKYAGIGWTGKNTCTINQQLGSWLFLGVIVTGLELPPSRPLALALDRCGSCTRCIDACPTGALVAPYQLDARLCISYLTIEKRGAIPEHLRAQIGRQVFGCDICQDVCPWNRRAPVSEDPELAVRQELVNPALEWLADLDLESFRRLFNHSPVSRTKLSGLLRNVAIAMGNSGLAKYLPRLGQWSEGDDPVLAESARWAIRRLQALAVDAEQVP